MTLKFICKSDLKVIAILSETQFLIIINLPNLIQTLP